MSAIVFADKLKLGIHRKIATPVSSHELSPPVLQHADLAAALQWITRHFSEQFGLQVELTMEGTQQGESGPLKVFVFRAVQELLFNVVKHAGVKKARVVLSNAEGFLVVTVSDQGRGIDPDILNSVHPQSGLGLLSLRERARHIGGNLSVESGRMLGNEYGMPFHRGLFPIILWKRRR